MRQPSRAEEDVYALLARIRQRFYPETVSVLGSFWLKTIYASGYGSRQWRELRDLLNTATRGPLPDELSRQILIDIQEWITRTTNLSRTSKARVPGLGPCQCDLSSKQVTGHIVRLLNEWLPMEVARLLAYEMESADTQACGIPALAIGAALERLLTRAHFSQELLERLLEPGLLSPEYVYPSDAEMLGDVVLSLLGRTRAPTPPPVMPATLVCVAETSHLPANYGEAVRNAYTIRGSTGEELHVPINPSQAVKIINNERVLIGSIIVTMDGRSWEAETVQSGERDSIVYRPIGRLRIEYSSEHAAIRIPWAENRLRWFGNGKPEGPFTLFGREWRVARWEVDSERTWLDLVFCRILPVSDLMPTVDTDSWKLRPASVDMAWAALENAVATSVAENSDECIEQLHLSELISLGRAIIRLNELLKSRKPEVCKIEMQLKAIQYLETPVIATHGRVPWRILPKHIRTTFLRVPRFSGLLELLPSVFEATPDVAREVKS